MIFHKAFISVEGLCILWGFEATEFLKFMAETGTQHLIEGCETNYWQKCVRKTKDLRHGIMTIHKTRKAKDD